MPLAYMAENKVPFACLEDACQMAELIEKEIPCLNETLRSSNAGTVIGAHTRPGTVALFFWETRGKE